MAPEDRDSAPSPDAAEPEAPAELSGTQLAGLWSRKRSVSTRGPRPERADDPPEPPSAA